MGPRKARKSEMVYPRHLQQCWEELGPKSVPPGEIPFCLYLITYQPSSFIRSWFSGILGQIKPYIFFQTLDQSTV
jgi:hypothetical protein